MGHLAVPTPSSVHSPVAPLKAETGYESLARKTDAGTYTLSVLVSGVTCALCIQKIESALAAEPGVQSARLNFGARRLFVEWDGPAARANDFVQMVQNLGYGVQPYDDQAAEDNVKSEGRFLLLCLGVAGFAMGNIMLLSVGVWSTTAETMGMGTRELLHWVSAVIALPTILFSGRPFFRSALKALSAGRSNMDVPISLAILLAGGMSLFETIQHGEHVYFDSVVMLMFFLLIGRYLDFKARETARSSASDFLKSFQGFATVVEGQGTKRVLIRDLKAGMVVRVAAGEGFPVDGVILEGHSTADTSLVTGETLPREIAAGQEIHAGTLNLSAPVTVRVLKAAEDSLLADIVRLMDKAGQAQAAYVRIADKAARLYTPVVHTLAALAFLGWFFLGSMAWQDALMIAVTVLIITCPCALGLAVPVVQVLATGGLMKKGVFVKSGDALERLSAIDTVMFDKTGTLTEGRLRLMGAYDPQALKLAASLAAHSVHPLSKAIVAAYEGDVFELEAVQEHEGQGLSGSYNGREIRQGSRSWCGDSKAPANEYVELWLAVEGGERSCFVFEDTLRDDAADIVALLKKEGLGVLLASGDREAVVRNIAAQAGIEDVYAGQSPKQKFEILEGLQAQGHSVLMAGDGLNDAPVLAGANVSIAPGTAVDMAQNAADIVFMGDQLAPLYTVYSIARRTQSLVKQNFALAVLYNMIAIPLAVGGYVTPFVAALAMSGSSLLVIANSFRLKLHS